MSLGCHIQWNTRAKLTPTRGRRHCRLGKCGALIRGGGKIASGRVSLKNVDGKKKKGKNAPPKKGPRNQKAPNRAQAAAAN